MALPAAASVADWNEWVSAKQTSYAKKMGAPSIIRYYYLTNYGDQVCVWKSGPTYTFKKKAKDLKLCLGVFKWSVAGLQWKLGFLNNETIVKTDSTTVIQ